MVSQGYKEPISKLTPFVERFWWVNIDAGTPLIPMDAGTGAELIFYFSSPLLFTCGTEQGFSYPISLVRVDKERLQLKALTSVSFLSVRFRTGMIRHFLPKTYVSGFTPVIDAVQIWGDKASFIYEKILSVKEPDKVIPLLEFFLLDLLACYHKSDRGTDYIASLLYYGSDEFTVQDIADRVGYSRRQLQRICSANFGISPKQYRSTVRFNRVKKKMLMVDNEHYLSYALDEGYYDQSHFIHEFERYTTLTPGEYIRDYFHAAHFYNRSLPVSRLFASGVK